MKFQLISDLHLERYESVVATDFLDIDTKADCLILAGDITSYPRFDVYLSLLEQVVPHYEHIVVICGNHEFYHSSVEKTKLKLNELVAKFDNVHFLDDSVLEFPQHKIALLGSTLWSWIADKHFFEARTGITDYKLIEKFTPVASRALHRKHVAWLEAEIQSRQGWKVIVVTHHLPSLKLIDPKYKGNSLNCAFATDVEDLMKPDIVRFWLSGHTHSSFDEMINGVRNLVNPRGYRTQANHQNEKFNPACCFDLV